ncbi:hypothetical protein LWI29_010886 [Acer saccharum]|uniref:Uncharacterized protein n=1 Tax=Acer saccharum TaxID=4024 RepID=A0AA39SFU4_ACESA|nr:hypothetical protein LWI29_010886 [Acer saccharum]
MDPICIEAFLFVVPLEVSRHVSSIVSRSSGVDASLIPPGAHSLLGSKTISVDPVVGNSLPFSLVRGSVSYMDLFKAPLAWVDIVLGPLIPSASAPSKKGGYVAIRVDPTTYKSCLEALTLSNFGAVSSIFVG